MDIDVVFAGIAVTDFPAARSWYARLFGRREDIVAHDEEVMWRLAGPAWVYVVRDPARAGKALVSIAVADLDAVVAEIEGRGVGCGPIEAVGDAGRKAPFTDADGNTVAFIEVT